MDVVKCILERRSIRSFLPNVPNDSIIREIIEVSRWTPSGKNR